MRGIGLLRTTSLAGACELLHAADDILIITHQKPDGDALGSAFALLWAVEKLGKRGRVECSDPFPERYGYFIGDYSPAEFEPGFVVSVDTASPTLFGSPVELWQDKIDLCIDHHRKNTIKAAHLLLNPEIPATAQIIYMVAKKLGVEICARMADAIFTGITTDTGCFRFSSVTAQTHSIAANLIDSGADHGRINQLMFETRPRALVELDKILLNTMQYHFGGLCAVMVVERDVTEQLGLTESDLDGISIIPRRIQGVEVGVVLRENEDKQGFRVSVRTRDKIDASLLCSKLGGGGHKAAAGCMVEGNIAKALEGILRAVHESLKIAGLLE